MNSDTVNLRYNILWNAAGNIIYLMCQWIVTVLVTVLGNFEDAGILSLAMSVSATFQTVAMFGIRSFQVSDVDGKYSDSCYVGFRVLTCGVSLVLCMVFSLICRYSGVQLLAIFLFMLFRLAECFSDVLHGIAQNRERLDIAGKAFCIKGIGLLICFLVPYWFSRNLNIGLLCMTAFSCASTLIYDLIAVRKLSFFHLQWDKTCGKMAMETLPLCVYLFFSAAMTTVPKLILEKQCGETILGAYSSIFAPALLLQAAAGYIYNPFAGMFSKYHHEGDLKAFRNSMLKILLLILAVFAVIFLLAQPLGEWALVLVFREQIREYISFLNPILLASAAVSCLGFFCMLTIVLRKFKLLLAACGVGMGICLFLTSPMIEWFGVNGASYCLILAEVLASAILLFGICLVVRARGDNK